MSKETNAQKKVTAETFRRLAKALRERARNHRKAAYGLAKTGISILSMSEQIQADVYAGLASDCDDESATLRAMR